MYSPQYTILYPYLSTDSVDKNRSKLNDVAGQVVVLGFGAFYRLASDKPMPSNWPRKRSWLTSRNPCRPDTGSSPLSRHRPHA